ncbi:hypothetical protein M5K25_012097 [Dendrobium thyrsiflorum]|uniref:phosphoglycerate mutase (2,3-diphosphoglycerate-dependent) n=1 Tax=Dendrobium thyrsiflorum TaxID=117978 RepID=A0ABD0UWP4_DENTH
MATATFYISMGSIQSQSHKNQMCSNLQNWPWTSSLRKGYKGFGIEIRLLRRGAYCHDSSQGIIYASSSHSSVADPLRLPVGNNISDSHRKSYEAALILIRHGESLWNEKNLFTGCVDVPLTRKGVEEAIEAGKRISNIPVDMIYTSALIRAQMTAMLAMTQHRRKKIPIVMHSESEQAIQWSRIYSEETRKQSIPVIPAWQLNERMYGELQGLNKQETAERFGKEKVHEWRRSFDIPPPNGESLEMCADRAVAYFRDHRPKFLRLLRLLSLLWLNNFLPIDPPLMLFAIFFFNLKLIGEFSVTVLNPKNVLIKLVNDLDYYRVFAHHSYFINNCYMRVIKWSPSFDVDIESPIIPIWVSFPNLRPHLYSPRILHGLGSIFGRPLKIDHATSTGSRPSVARVLVELDVSKYFPDKVWVGPDNLGFIQSVVMEDLPSYCSHCKSLGHSKLECHFLHPQLVTRNNVGDELVNIGNKLPLIVNHVENFCSDPLRTCGEGLSVVPSMDVLRDPSEQVANGIDGSLIGALSLAHSCGNNVDKVADCIAPTCGINEDVGENNCLINVVASSFVPLISNGDCAGVSPVDGLSPTDACDGVAAVSDDIVPLGSGDQVVNQECLDSTASLLEPSNKILVDIPVSLISNEVLKVQLASVEQNDWLEEDVFSHRKGVGEDFLEFEDDIQAMFILKDNRSGEKASALRGGKSGRRNSRRNGYPVTPSAVQQAQQFPTAVSTSRRPPSANQKIEPQLLSGKNVMIAAHGNSLRSIIMYLDKLTSHEVINLELSTGIPMLYIFKEGKFIRRGSPAGPSEAGVYAYTLNLARYRQKLDEMLN